MAGDIVFNAGESTMQYCNGANWIAFPKAAGSGGGAPQTLLSTLNNPSPNASDEFGTSVAVSGAVAVVGAPFDESDGGAGVSAAGRAYVFDTTTGNLIATLNNPSPNTDDRFGITVAVSGTTAVIGAIFDESDGGTGVMNAGRAYVFDTTTGNLIATLNNPSPNGSDRFGSDVAPDWPSFITGLCSPCGPIWTGLQTRSG